jgi:hypothetical protein
MSWIKPLLYEDIWVEVSVMPPFREIGIVAPSLNNEKIINNNG